jgi:branched-chain amino acid aminotransferase
MSKGKYILVDGSFVLTEDYRITLAESESFHFTEKFRVVRTAFPFFKETLELIRLKLKIFNQSYPEFTEREGAGLKRQLERTLTKNKHFMGACLSLTLRFTDQEVHYSIQSEKLEYPGFTLNEKGIYVDILKEIQKPVSALSNLSFDSEIYWEIAKKQVLNATADQLLIVNTAGHLVEAPHSNVYLIKGETVRGAGIQHGAYVDISRTLILEIVKKLHLEYSDDAGIRMKDIHEAEEIMIVNSIDGVRWVAGFEGKRYFNNTIRKISELFNQLTIS